MTKEEFFRKMVAANKSDDSYDRMMSILHEANVTVKLTERKPLGRCYEMTTYTVEMPWQISDIGKEIFFKFGLTGSGQSWTAREVNSDAGRYGYQFVATCDSSD